MSKMSLHFVGVITRKNKQLISGLLIKYEILCTEKASELGQVMVQGGGTFGTFMSIGTAIRC